MQSLLILGRQPAIGLAELISLYGESKVTNFSNQAAVVDIDPCNLDFKRLGGSTKFCKVLTSIETTDWSKIENFLIKESPAQTLNMPEGKITFGISLYGFNLDPKSIISSGSKLKKAIQKTGRSVRFVPNKTVELNTAQVIHNKLTNNKGWELVIVRDENKTIIAQTVMVQDINGYARRDQARPHRDSRIGMLPPKLAQIIINLAVGLLPEDQLNSVCEDDATVPVAPPVINQTILDPFCGTGVVLQEASLMGYGIAGSDINPKMINYTTRNLEWLKTQFRTRDIDIGKISFGDAISCEWPDFDFVATETNLGKPLSMIPSPPELSEITKQSNQIIEGFLVNLAKQTKSGTRICVAVPAWKIRENQFKHLPLIDRISNLGYNLVDFKHISAEQLIYYRPDQVVARQLLVMIRK
jgi:tRNA G10  N-methylase Trm11